MLSQIPIYFNSQIPSLQTTKIPLTIYNNEKAYFCHFPFPPSLSLSLFGIHQRRVTSNICKNVLTDNKTIDAPKNIHMEKQPFDFLENSKVMYEKVCEAVPWFIRPLLKSSILKGIEEHGCQEVTETCLYQVVKQVTPKKHIERTLELLDRHKTA
jgi:hypothetical protein